MTSWATNWAVLYLYKSNANSWTVWEPKANLLFVVDSRILTSSSRSTFDRARCRLPPSPKSACARVPSESHSFIENDQVHIITQLTWNILEPISSSKSGQRQRTRPNAKLCFQLDRRKLELVNLSLESEAFDCFDPVEVSVSANIWLEDFHQINTTEWLW